MNIFRLSILLLAIIAGCATKSNPTVTLSSDPQPSIVVKGLDPHDLHRDARRVAGLADTQDSYPRAGWLPGRLDLVAKVSLRQDGPGRLAGRSLGGVVGQVKPGLSGISGLDGPNVGGDHTGWGHAIGGRPGVPHDECRAHADNRQDRGARQHQP